MSDFVRVVLENNWNTPLGRFKKSVLGEPVEIPKRVIRRYQLPSSAMLVNDDYVPPNRRDEEPVAMTPAEMEAEVERRLKAREAEEDAKRRGEDLMKQRQASEAALKKGDEDLLDENVSYIESQLSGMSIEDLIALRDREQAGKTRKSLMKALDAAIGERDEELGVEDEGDEE